MFMRVVEVVGVVGTCAPERHQYARRRAAERGGMLVPAARLVMGGDAITEAVALAPWAEPPGGAIVEFPSTTPVAEIIGAFVHDDLTRLVELVCVVDATHLLRDLRRDDYVTRRIDGDEFKYTAHALHTVTQLELASTVFLVNWDALTTDELSTTMALVSHLSPAVRLKLDLAGSDLEGLTHEPRDLARGPGRREYERAQEQPGWVQLLNREFEPHMTDARVSAFRYDRPRPFHPKRLEHLLDETIEPATLGTVVRSCGFARLATRSTATAKWEHIGSMFSLIPLQSGDDTLELGQDLAFIGLDLEQSALEAALDEALLTDAEIAAGPDAWAEYPDPFPAWETSGDPAD